MGDLTPAFTIAAENRNNYHFRMRATEPTGSSCDASPRRSGEAAAGASADQRPRRVSSSELLGGAAELVILHGQREYRLRVTSNGKLILTA